MATRNLTEPFVLMRNNALQSKHFSADQNMSDKMALVNSDNQGSESVELAGFDSSDTTPPAWTDALEETQYILSRLKHKIGNLIELQAKHLTRPTLDDTSQEERQMEQLIREISRAFSSGHRQVQIVKNAGRHEKRPADRQLAMSVVLALSSALQELGFKYKSAQNNYLQQINSREERNRPFFEEDQMFFPDNSNDSWTTGTNYNDNNTEQYWELSQQQKQQSVLLQIEEAEENIRIAAEREQEVGHIVQSITDLNYVFKDLATMVHDQGTILDRIDYNVEQTQCQVQEGYKQLKKAETYQRANRKMYCIMILAMMIILLCFLIVVFKT
ncbi:hypothetical protein HCN44_000264 [Aphidius gifuensis]|uniref:t-SNARE coiled-coil homology domain-containing protein n=1 Tax=Aphidius gifuensis TaxID=684658 RepID=A0A834XSG2_APHGI|nr:syntaxin-16 [Aphidius gifuensis]KAF7990459.1 hypothetical protein HCN44_000264 [Aphidius gifuensis]